MSNTQSAKKQHGQSFATWQEEYKSKLTTAQNAVKMIKSGDVIAMQGGTGIPPAIADALGKRGPELKGVKCLQGFAVAFHEYMKPDYRDSFRVETVFIGPAERFCMAMGTVDFVPNHLNNLGRWMDTKNINVVVAVVTPPDENGYMNRSCFGGLCPERTIENADVVLVEVNSNTPWLCSDAFKVHVSQVDAIVLNTAPLFEIPEIEITPVEESIAHIIADMIPDGSCIQLGLGGLANCIGHFLKDKKHLGAHTEVVSNSLMELIKCGALDCSEKNIMKGKIPFTFCVGTKELWEFMDRNEMFVGYEIEKVNDPNFISQNDNMVSVNNALMVDLTGQVASESIGTNQFSATGGQVNYVHGAQRSKNGKSILALPSTRVDKEGVMHSRIMPTLPEGTIVTTSRNDVQWIVTEYGAVCLNNMPVSYRAKELIRISHPDFRDQMTFEAKKHKWL
jgi:4-hydroxybutyrate CoA-transferase